MNKASASTTEYLRARPRCNVSHDSPFSFQYAWSISVAKISDEFRHRKPLYEWYDDHPTEAARFALAQAGIEKSSFLQLGDWSLSMLTAYSEPWRRSDLGLVFSEPPQSWDESDRCGSRQR